MKVFIASDHAGFTLKSALIEHIRALGYDIEDMGAFSLDQNDDYPDVVMPLAKRVAASPGARGIIIGGSGQGEAICVNRIPGVRAAVFYGEPPHPQADVAGAVLDMISSVRMHNDANILSLGARFVTLDDARVATQRFLDTPFSGEERHQRRLAKF